MKRAALVAGAVVILLAAVVSPATAGGARQALDDGISLFGARRYDEAAAKFEEAAAKGGPEGLDPAVARYDQAVAILKAGKGAGAAEVLGALLNVPDSRLRESVHYHRGIALAMAADAAEGGGDLRKAVSLLDEALKDYESAMRIDPGDEDPKVNHELVSRKRAQLAAKLQERQGGAGQGRQSEADDAQAGQRPQEEQQRREPERQQSPRQRSAEGEMRPDEARTLLDAMRQQELSQRGKTRPFRGETIRVEKDW